MKSLMHHPHPGSRNNVRSPSLQHGSVGPVLVEILRNIMSAIPGPHDENLLPANIVTRRIIVLAAVVDSALEPLSAWDAWDPGLP